MRGLYCITFILCLVGCSHGNTKINSVPVDASVFIDDQFVGKTPLDISLKKQNHRVRIDKDGYDTINDYITVVKRDSAILTILLFPFYWIYANDFQYTFEPSYYFELKQKDTSGKNKNH